MTAAANRLTFLNLQSTMPTADLESLKLDRLRELKATIESLRCEQSSHDPLLDWAIAEASRTQRE
jgi:hypothetical protein